MQTKNTFGLSLYLDSGLILEGERYMGTRHIPCGPFANQSERHATEYLKTRLTGTPGQWVLLTNHASSAGIQWLADELDVVVIGPSGVHPIEIKHWNTADLHSKQQIAEREADKLNEKARRLKGRLQRACIFDFGFIAGKFLLTKGENEKFREGIGRKHIRGIPVFGLSEWRELFELERSPILTNEQVTSLCKALEPLARVALGDKIRVFGDFFDLEKVPGLQDPFHQVYRGRRKPGRDRVILHIYDLSASKEKNAYDIAKREFDVLQRLQKSLWLPSLLDSFQEAPSYPGELYFFSYIDTEAPNLADRSGDPAWSIAARLYTAKRCIEAVKNLHEHGLPVPDGPILHSNLTPHSIHVRSNGEPLLTQLHGAKLSGATTVAGIVELEGQEQFVAPEVLTGGIGASTIASDIHALCASLRILFEGSVNDPQANRASEVLATGIAEDPSQRCSLENLLS
ncbi:MAG: NERD domain-containing protein, partial [Candidatus Binatia bacterium]